ncbi:hatching enzyme 1.2-like [Lampetra planeri]
MVDVEAMSLSQTPRSLVPCKTELHDLYYSLEWGDIAVPRNRIFGNKWPKSENGKVYVPYKVSLAFFDGDVKKIEEAALEFKKKTCVRFIPRSNETDYIYIHAWEGNWSFLGCHGRDQALSLDPGKVTKGVVLHEFMHALGFYHEHSRIDRDKYILMLIDNVKPGTWLPLSCCQRRFHFTLNKWWQYLIG